MTKAELRKTFTIKRNLLTEAACLSLSYRLCEHFFATIDLQSIQILHTYIPIEKNKEPDTWPIIDRIRREFPQIRLVVPKVNAATNELDNFFFEGIQQLKKNSWGIPEPVTGLLAKPEILDMVLVPLLAFDHRGHRVGYGKGFYDKLFAQCKPSCSRVGLSFFPSSSVIDDIHEYDIPLTQVVTPEETISF